MSRLSIAAACLLVAAVFACVGPSRASAATAPQTDVMFLFDTSGSMTGALGEAKEEIKTVINQLSASTPDVAFGVANVEDYPGYDDGSLNETKTETEYEEDPEKPWRLDQPVTTEQSKVFEAIEALSGSSVAHGGGDPPEAYGRALWETDTNPNVAWRPGARHLIVLIADQVPHNPNVDEGIPEEFWAEPSPWNTGEEQPGRWGIPGTQLKEGEKLDFHAVLRQLASDGKPLEMVDYHDTEGDYIHYWEHWASLAGGQAFEASEGGHEFASKLISAVEHVPEDTACATAAIPTAPSPALSPAGPSGLPTALTPRFLQPGSTITATPPGGKVFCTGQDPALGGSVITNPQEATAEKLVFEVPPTAADGVELTDLAGVLGPELIYGVDNFRYPWGFKISNTAGSGGVNTKGIHTYDSVLSKTVIDHDLESVFTGLGPRTSPEWEEAEELAEADLKGGLCYGFGLLSWDLYGDAHGQAAPLSWALSSGFGLSPGTMPYSLEEEASGEHGLTQALLKASVSQYSPESKETRLSVNSSASLANYLNEAFAKRLPAMLMIKWHLSSGREVGHALLAFNYQSPDPRTGEGIAVDVVDPDVPWSVVRPSTDYETLQLHMKPNGSWTYDDGAFGTASAGSSGLKVILEPRNPGKLHLSVQLAGNPSPIALAPTNGGEVVGVGYSGVVGNTLPSDVTNEPVVDDAPTSRLLIPSTHHDVTVRYKSASGDHAGLRVAGAGFLDESQVSAMSGIVTIASKTGALSTPLATHGTVLSATTVVGGAQYTATARFTGQVRRPTLTVNRAGEVSVTAAGGHGHVSLTLATFNAAGEQAHARPERLTLHGRARIHRHTPKIKRRRRKRSKHKPRHKH